MFLFIVTISRNNAEGLRKTIISVSEQHISNFEVEHIIIDGASTDKSIDLIKELAGSDNCGQYKNHIHYTWISEPDKGIYNAMNKGIEIAMGRRVVNAFHRSELVEDKNKGFGNSDAFNNSNHYIQILNSGDILATPDTCAKMLAKLKEINEHSAKPIDILYGNMLKVDNNGKLIGKSGYTEYSLRQFYSSTLNHDCAYIRASLFEEYGLYDENLKVVSDWKWYLQAIGLGHVKPIYADIDVTIFDAGGISETNLDLRNKERRQVLEEVIPPAVLWDYDQHAFEVAQMNRLRKHHLYPLIYFIERTLFKFEKWSNKFKNCK